MSHSLRRRIFVREAIPRTKTQSLVLAGGLTVMPIALMLFGNRGAIVAPAPIYAVAAGSAVVAVLLTLALSRIVAPHVAAAICGALGYAFFSMSWTGQGGNVQILLLLWVSIALLASVILVWLLSDSAVVINLAAVSVVSVCAGLLTSFALTSADAPPGANSDVPDALAFVEEPSTRPNVYVFVLDGFGRPDILMDQFAQADIALDLSASVRRLEALGYVQDPAASANYVETVLSVPSTLNNTLHHTPEQPMASRDVWATARAALQGDNQLVRSLRNVGYEYWHSGSGIWDVSACNEDIADVCLGESLSNIESNAAVWPMTPVRHHVGRPDPAGLSDPLTVVADVLATRTERTTDTPYILFSHIISPHQPYRFDRSCDPIDPEDNGSSLNVGHVPHFRQFYADQAICLGSQLNEAMTTLNEADPTAIVLLQADHGSSFTIDFSNPEWTEESLNERLGVFRMTKMPDTCRSSDPRAQSLVNTAPLIIACLAGESPQFVEPELYLTSYNANFSVTQYEATPALSQ